MNETDRWDYIAALDEEFLLGGVILSEWCSLIVREADTAFAHGAHLASILTAVSGAETYLRSEYSTSRRDHLADLIDNSPIKPDLKADLHTLRKYRNKWVHVESPWEDTPLLESPEAVEIELEEMGRFAARVLRRTIYESQWVYVPR